MLEEEHPIMALNRLHTSISIVAEATFADRFCASGYGPGGLSCDAQNLRKQIAEPSLVDPA